MFWRLLGRLAFLCIRWGNYSARRIREEQAQPAPPPAPARPKPKLVIDNG